MIIFTLLDAIVRFFTFFIIIYSFMCCFFYLPYNKKNSLEKSTKKENVKDVFKLSKITILSLLLTGIIFAIDFFVFSVKPLDSLIKEKFCKKETLDNTGELTNELDNGEIEKNDSDIYDNEINRGEKDEEIIQNFYDRVNTDNKKSNKNEKQTNNSDISDLGSSFDKQNEENTDKNNSHNKKTELKKDNQDFQTQENLNEINNGYKLNELYNINDSTTYGESENSNSKSFGESNNDKSATDLKTSYDSLRRESDKNSRIKHSGVQDSNTYNIKKTVINGSDEIEDENIDMEYVDSNHLYVPPDYKSDINDLGYYYLMPEKWYQTPPVPPVCLTNKKNKVMPKVIYNVNLKKVNKPM